MITVQVYGATQVVGPVKPIPPHCAYCAAPVPVPVPVPVPDPAPVLVDAGGATLVGVELPLPDWRIVDSGIR